MQNFIFSINVVMPLFVVLSIGYLLRKFNFVDQQFLNTTNKLCFKLFIPFLLFINIYQTQTNIKSNLSLVAFSVSAIIICILLLIIFIPMIEKDTRKRGVLVQAIYRSNFVLFGIPLSYNLFGSAGVGISSVLIAIVVPIFNVSAVLILSFFDSKSQGNIKSITKDIITNPLIGAAVLALLMVHFKIIIPSAIESGMSSIAQIATPLTLIVLGGDFKFTKLKKYTKQLILGVTGKLIIVPLIALTVAINMGFRGMDLGTLIALFCSPTAVSSYIMAKNANGDHELAGELVVLTTLFSIITIFLFIYIIKWLGYI